MIARLAGLQAIQVSEPFTVLRGGVCRGFRNPEHPI
jgi:hypothetical protein